MPDTSTCPFSTSSPGLTSGVPLLVIILSTIPEDAATMLEYPSFLLLLSSMTSASKSFICILQPDNSTETQLISLNVFLMLFSMALPSTFLVVIPS